jgi:hypothetical protein
MALFETMEERFKNEIYTVVRTLQSMLLGQELQHHFTLAESVYVREAGVQKLKDIMKLIA